MITRFNLSKELGLKLLLLTVIMIDVFLSIQHVSKSHILKNILFFCGISGVFFYYYINHFFTEQIRRASSKKLWLTFAIALMISINISRVSHYNKYFPFGLLCFIIIFFISLYCFTLEIQQVKQQTLQDIYNPKNNSFTLLRFILASIVLIYHFGLHGGRGPFISTGLTYNFFGSFLSEGGLAVWLFFVISGFFMIQSLQNSKNNSDYLIKRFLRIFPLFILLHLISFMGTRNLFEFLQAFTLNAFGGGYAYNMQYEPTFSLDFNSSWTLSLEFLCYLLLLFIYKVANAKKVYCLIITVFFIIVDLLFVVKYGGINYFQLNIFNNYNHGLVSFLPMFLVASSMYLYKDKIPVNKHTILFSFFLLFIFMFRNVNMASSLGLLVIIPYLLISICSIVKIQLWTKIGDYSYGIYLIHPIVYNNLGNYFFPHYQRNFKNLIIVYVITLILSIVSWHLIEKPAMKLKYMLTK